MRKFIKGVIGGLIAFVVIVSGIGAINDTNYIENALGGNLFSTSDALPNIYFRNEKTRRQHYEKHGKAMGFSSAKDYERAAANVIDSDDALHKTEQEDGDDIYYLERTNELVIVSEDGYIRTYFNPTDGIDYFNRIL